MNNADYMKRLGQLESPDSTYTKANPPLVLKSAQGSLIKDAQGCEYIDLCAGFGVMSLGHNSPLLREVLEEQLSPDAPIIHGMGDVYPTTSKVAFLEDLLDAMPPHLSLASLALSGSQAVEIAIKTCILRKPKGHILTFQGSYHGLDLGILPFTSRKDFKEPFTDWFVQDLTIELPFGAPAHEVRRVVETLPQGLSAIVVEPIQGRAGVVSPPEGWLQELRDICDQQDALLVFDEVFTGLGRIGTLTSAFEIKADLVCLGKALGGGLPLSACVGTQESYGFWPSSEGEALHTGTFFGHPLSCRLGSKILRTLSQPDFLLAVQKQGEFAIEYLKSRLEGESQVTRIGGQGMMLVIEFSQAGRGAQLMNQLREDRVIALASGPQGESLSMTPALNIPQSILVEALDRIIARI